jgi:hypothetical protein
VLTGSVRVGLGSCGSSVKSITNLRVSEETRNVFGSRAAVRFSRRSRKMCNKAGAYVRRPCSVQWNFPSLLRNRKLAPVTASLQSGALGTSGSVACRWLGTNEKVVICV